MVFFVLAGFGGVENVSVFSSERVVRSSHFVVHHEDPYVPAGLLGTLESLHAKLLLDLGAFSPWAYKEPIDVYLYSNAESYSRHTGMPPFTEAHVRLDKRTIYCRPGDDLQRVLAHEMGHLFFSQFFLTHSAMPPLWLNEGVATLMEYDYGGETVERARQAFLAARGPIPFELFFQYNYAHAASTDSEIVGLWYTQAQSVARLLMRDYSQRQFVVFCDGVRRGKSLDQALSAAYGLNLSDARSLEKTWLTKNHLYK